MLDRHQLTCRGGVAMVRPCNWCGKSVTGSSLKAADGSRSRQVYHRMRIRGDVVADRHHSDGAASSRFQIRRVKQPIELVLMQRHCERQRSNPSCRTKKEWIASSQELLAMTYLSGMRSRSRDTLRPSFVRNSSPFENRGRGECRMPNAPAAWCALGVVKYAHQYSQRRHRKHPAFPTQWFYGVWHALPGDEFVLPPSLTN